MLLEPGLAARSGVSHLPMLPSQAVGPETPLLNCPESSIFNFSLALGNRAVSEVPRPPPPRPNNTQGPSQVRWAAPPPRRPLVGLCTMALPGDTGSPRPAPSPSGSVPLPREPGFT